MPRDQVLKRIRAMKGSEIHITIDEMIQNSSTPPQVQMRLIAIKKLMEDDSLSYPDVAQICHVSHAVIYRWAKLFLSKGISGLIGKLSGWSGKSVIFSSDTLNQIIQAYDDEKDNEAVCVVGQVLACEDINGTPAPYGWIYRSRVSFDKASAYGNQQPLKIAAHQAFDCDRAQRLTLDLPFLYYTLKIYVIDVSDRKKPKVVRLVKSRG